LQWGHSPFSPDDSGVEPEALENLEDDGDLGVVELKRSPEVDRDRPRDRPNSDSLGGDVCTTRAVSVYDWRVKKSRMIRYRSLEADVGRSGGRVVRLDDATGEARRADRTAMNGRTPCIFVAGPLGLIGQRCGGGYAVGSRLKRAES
jgi:hypothetical protein